MLGARGSNAAKMKGPAATAKPTKAKGAGPGRVGDIRCFMVERPGRLDEYNPKLRYRLVRTGAGGTADLVDLPFKPPDDVVMTLGRSSSADKKPRAPGAPIKVQLGIASDNAYLSRNQVRVAATTMTGPAAATAGEGGGGGGGGGDSGSWVVPEAVIALTSEGRFTVTNPSSTSRAIMVRRGVKVMGEREMKTLAPGDDPCPLHVGDVIVLDGNETRPQYTWRFEDDSPKQSPTSRAQQSASLSAVSSSSSSSSSASVGLPSIQAAVRLSGPENHHPNEPTPSSPAHHKTKQPPSRPTPSTSQKQQPREAEASTTPAPTAAIIESVGGQAAPRKLQQEEEEEVEVVPSRPSSEARAAATPKPASSLASSGGGASTPTPRRDQQRPSDNKAEGPITLDHTDDEEEQQQKKRPPAPAVPRTQQRGAGTSGAAPSPAKRPTPTTTTTRPICLDMSDYEHDDDEDDDDEVEVVSVAMKPAFDVGQNVFVLGRMGPGMNKPGGFGRVTAATEQSPGVYRYDVKYVLGGKETQLEGRLLSAANYLEEPRPRKRMSSTSSSSSAGRAQGAGSSSKRPRTQEGEGSGKRPAAEEDDDDSVVDLVSDDSDAEEEAEQRMEVEERMMEVEEGGTDWAVLKQQSSAASMGDEEDSGGEASEEMCGSQGDGDDVLGLRKAKVSRRRRRGSGGSSTSEGEKEEEQRVVTVRCTLCSKAFKLKCQSDSDKMAVHLRQCQRVAVKREKDRRGSSGHGAAAGPALLVAKEMPSSLSVCLGSNLSVQDPSFLLSALERWLAVKNQTVSLKFHQDLLATFRDTACPLRARCFRRILDRLHASFPAHRCSSSWRPLDVLAFTRLLHSVDTDKFKHDLRGLRSRALLLDYHTTIFEDEVEDLRSRGQDDERGLKHSMLGRLVLSVAQGTSSQEASQARRLRSVMDLALKACSHAYVRADGKSRTALLALPKSSKECAKIGKDSLKWFIWSDAPEVRAATVLVRLMLLMCEIYDASPPEDDGSFVHSNAASLLDNRLKSVPEAAHIKATERTLYRYMPGRASRVLPGYAAWEKRALGGLFNDIKAAGF